MRDRDPPSWKSSLYLAIGIGLLAIPVGIAGVNWLQRAELQFAVGGYNPAGTHFVCSEYNGWDRGYSSRVNVTIRDATTGAVTCDLTNLTELPWRGQLRWSADGQRLVGISQKFNPQSYLQRVSIVEVFAPISSVEQPQNGVSAAAATSLDVGEHARLVSDWYLPEDGPCTEAFFDTRGRVVHVKQQRSDTHWLEVIANSSLSIRRLEFGNEEYASVCVTADDRFVDVTISPDTLTGGNYLLSNGKDPAFYRLDLLTDELVGPLHGNYASDPQQSEFIYRYTDAIEVYQADNLNEPVLNVTDSAGPTLVAISPRRFVSGGWGSRELSIHTLDGKRREMAIPSADQELRAAPEEKVDIVSSGRLVRVDVDTGLQSVVFDLRKGMRAYRAVAVVGLLLIWCVPWLVRRRHASRYPFLDMLWLLLTTVVIFLVWSVFGIQHFVPHRLESIVGFVALGGFVGLASIAATTSMFVLGTKLPIGITVAAMIAVIMVVWSQGDAYRATEGVSAGVLYLGWGVAGLSLFRLCFGKLHRGGSPLHGDGGVHVPTTAGRSQRSQLTLRQILLIVAACCLLLTVVRFIDFRELQGVSNVFLHWLVTYTTIFVFAMLAALWTAMRVSHVVVSGVAYLCIVLGYEATHYLATVSWNVNLAWDVPTRYGLPVVAGLLIWIALRYCRAEGYRLGAAS